MYRSSPLKKIASAAAVLGMTGGACALAAAPAGAATSAAQATLTGGSLGFVSSPSAVTFTGTINGQAQTLSTTQTMDVGDATGSGAGWNITASGSQFSSASPAATLPTTAVTMTAAPTVACDASTNTTCTTATTNVSYAGPYTLPMGASPTATKVFNATANTGMGNQTATATWKLTVPANAVAATYNSTWTFTLSSAP
jgi:hypothetical protein